MKTNITLLSLFILSLVLNGYSQNKKVTTTQQTDEIPFYYENGVKIHEITKSQLLFTNLSDKVSGNLPEEMALDWVSKHQTQLGINDIHDLTVSFKRSSLSGHNVRLQQSLNGIPVYKSQISVHINPKNVVTYVDNLFDPTLDQINTSPNISKENAFTLACSNIKSKGRLSFSSNELMIYNQLENTQLIYKIVIESETPIGSWEVIVDANNGDVIKAVDKAFYYKDEDHNSKKTPVNGTGNVFLSDPLSAAGVPYGGNYSDNSDATNAQMDAAMASVTLLDIDETAGVFTLKGPYAEIVDEESPFNGLYTQSSNDFSFNRNDDAFEAVNCYYLIDNSIRYINQTLNISLTPYQYVGGVQYDPHGLGGADNSYYSGGSGRLVFGEGCVDDAEDADVVIHELGHGIHDWLTGGNASSSEGLGEGSGDYWAQSYGRVLNQWTPADPEYQWMFNWDGHNTCWNGRITNYTATYPGGLGGGIHASGQIWATSLMRIYDQIGRSKTDKAFLEGLAMTGGSSGQQDAAIAVRQAAIDMNYSCADIDVFTTEFTATGYALPAFFCTVGIDELSIDNIKLYPNPTSDIITLVLPVSNMISKINLIDNLGRTVYINTINNNETQINLEKFAKGVYTLLIKTNDKVITKKIVKE
tara:strand:+ start:571 stop:2499 length:1929 start_codon:yes stop_codon:yes gene_type:complete